MPTVRAAAGELVSQFTSNEDLLDAVLASVHLPFLADGAPWCAAGAQTRCCRRRSASPLPAAWRACCCCWAAARELAWLAHVSPSLCRPPLTMPPPALAAAAAECRRISFRGQPCNDGALTNWLPCPPTKACIRVSAIPQGVNALPGLAQTVPQTDIDPSKFGSLRCASRSRAARELLPLESCFIRRTPRQQAHASSGPSALPLHAGTPSRA
jgi:hypothetical protein